LKKLEKYRQEMIEAAAEQDDELMMKYLRWRRINT
jgi:translation elongation factor EF-G